ncbi:MAG: hypothetical protein KGN00_04300 [Chloroflexota bacterium]|nr:hypothetical protein [Chloroflexota bacterium]MDE3192891.1 hypothetical protein [Chloroflexota bacterium]
MRRGARLAAVFVAALAWATVVMLVVEWSGVITARSAVVAAGPIDDDLCALRQGLPAGQDARCGFPLRQEGGAPVFVELRQTWVSLKPTVVLSQHLVVTPAGATSPSLDAGVQTAATKQPQRIIRLAVIPVADAEHLVYVVGECGGTACGRNELVIARWVSGRMQELLRRPLGALAEIELGPSRVTTLEGTGKLVGQQLDPRMQRTFTWAGDRYVESAFHAVPTATPTPTVTPLSR